MKKVILLVMVVATITMAFRPAKGVIGTMFPDMVCENYNGKAVTIPADTKGKYTLLCMAFSTAAEPDLKTWIDPIYNKFIGKVDASKADVFDVHTDYDVNLYFVPMFTGFNKLASQTSKDKIKSKTDKELYPYLLFYDGGKTYKDELDFQKRDIPYFFVLDKTGKVVYTTSGKYDDKKMEKIIDIFEEN
ncbi:MAG: TlpA family protein disulfide reductase [Bacteroidia bacterium]